MILAADNINAMNPVVADSIARLDPAPIKEIAAVCEKKGVEYIDINPGYLSRKNADRMAFLVETVQEATPLNLILDSPDPAILRAGLKVCRKPPILNALTDEKIKLKEIPSLAAEYGAGLIILLLDKKSICPPTLEGKISLAIDLMEKAGESGLKPENLIIDPVMPNIAWPDAFEQLGNCIRTIRMISTGAVTGRPVKTIIGLSNLLSGRKHPQNAEIEKSCLLLFAGAGLDIALANVAHPHVLNIYEYISEII